MNFSTKVRDYVNHVFFFTIGIIVSQGVNNNLEFLTVVAKTLIVTEISFDSHVPDDPGLSAIIRALLTFLNVSLLYNSHRTLPLLCYMSC